MQARIRVKTREGRELSPGSLTVFTRLVKSGEISETDLIYDALTGEWAPARAHPVFRMVADSIVDDEGDQVLGGAVPPEESEQPAAGSPDLALSLAPPAPEPSAEEANAAFIAQMEAERAADPDRPAAQEELGLLEGSAKHGQVVRVFEQEEEEPADVESTPTHVRRARTPSRPRYADGRRAGPRVLWMVGGLMLLTASVAVPAGWVLARSDAGERDPGARAVARDARLIEDAAREEALTAVMEDATRLRDELGVGPIPPLWLEGAYLADAASHPEVRAAWEQYLALVWALRASEELRYREAYLARLDREGVQGSLRTMRLTTAILAFRRARPDRERAYERVEELAVAALSLHDLLVHLSGSIRYEPARGGTLSADPVIEAVGVDPASQELLEDALDRVTLAVEADGRGPGTRENIPRWLEEQIAAALAPTEAKEKAPAP